MAVIMKQPDKYAKCICCGSDNYTMHEFQFFQDISCKTCITLCNHCVHMLDNTVIEEVCNKLNNNIKKVEKGGIDEDNR